MSFSKKIIALTLFASAIAFFATPQVQAQTASGGFNIQMHVEPQAAAYIKFDGIDGECTVVEGRNIVGSNTQTGDKLVLVVKNGKLSGFGVELKRGVFKALSPNAAPCFSITCTTFNPPKCFTIPGGACVCVCGPWITSGAGRN